MDNLNRAGLFSRLSQSMSLWLSRLLRGRSLQLRRLAQRRRETLAQAYGSETTERLEDRTLLTTFTPNVFTDAAINAGNDGTEFTLREAIIAANNSPSDDIIELAAGTYELSIVGDDIALYISMTSSPLFGADPTVGDLDVLGGGTLTIRGNAGGTIVDGKGIDAVFQAGSFNGIVSDLTIENLTITGGVKSGVHVPVLNTNATNLTVRNSTIVGNSSNEDRGGGIQFIGGGHLQIENSTISGNTADSAGMFAFLDGGGLEIGGDGSATILNSTITGNTAAEAGTPTNGGGVVVSGDGNFLIANTIIAGNNANNDLQVSLGSGTLTVRNSFIGSTNGSGIIGSNGNITGNPMLGALASNGGPTQTHALLAGSTAIDAGNNTDAAALTSDQRGYTPRAFNSTVDIGAYEFGATAPVSNSNPTITVGDLSYTEGDNSGNPVLIDAAATVSDSDGDADWDGGKLEVQITANNEAADEISISAVGSVTVVGSDVKHGGTTVGTISESSGTTNDGVVTNGDKLTINFNSSATNAIVQDVVRAIAYRSTSGAPGTTARTVTFTVTDKNSGAGSDTSTITVIDLPELAIAATSATKAEGNSGNTAFTFTVTRTGVLSGASSASWAVTGSSGSPANVADFGGSLPSGTVSFLATETSKVVTVNVSGDTIVESDEGFTVTLSSPTGATLGTSTATGTIQNDDTQLDIAATSTDKAEGN
ncbi:MAG: hypothetical protein KDA89_15970, partial [Planctomycetaceae bacterium]|nr:hypothetical protein [Planctomycetaceae bacterium]